MTTGSLPVFGVDSAALEGADLAERVTVTLTGPEGHHAADVRRVRVGEQVVITDGGGQAALGRVEHVERGRVRLTVVRTWTEVEAQPRLVVVQALAKGDRATTAVETLAEVGVDVIVPWAAERSVVRWDEDRARRGLDRWRSTAREAAKQARRTRWPEVRDLATTADVVDLVGSASIALVLHESADEALSEVAVPASGDIVVVVGPEGGLTDAEVASLLRAGAHAVRLGPTVLRTSTAGTVAAAVLLARTARWTEALS